MYGYGQKNIKYNESNKAYCLACIFDHGEKKLTVRKKYIRIMKSEPMNEFIKEGGTYYTYIKAMLYHTFLLVILGSSVLAKSVEKEVRSNNRNMLFCRDHSESYTPCQTGEIMSKEIGIHGDISMEGAMVLYKSEESDSHQKMLYTIYLTIRNKMDLQSGVTQNTC